ncbi:SIR2 family protein [Microbacterium sp. LRZ72]|uniref:SIR2 family protein n=1 Tax=Microbacterium sp. LRZ72 TaxID=2942481 RepID=UPI0029A6F953|nr:SIR2 family protein [Microbacterium sp. LRZ72]MDX2377868.1 SIR2 family protein [Microbacterium sp. LRZ72]
MSAPDLDANVMGQLFAAGAESHVTILLGAGASIPVGLPSWDEFAARLLVTSGAVTSRKTADVLVKSKEQEPSIVVEAAHAAAKDRWHEALQRALYEGDAPLKPSSVHLAAAGHFRATSTTRTTLLTLNYDVLLELALVGAGASSVEVKVGRDEPHESQPGEGNDATVHHLHGVITSDFALDPIVGYSDYAELVDARSPWQREILESALENGTLLLVGTSYRDPDIRHWLHVILRDKQPKHPAVVLIVRQAFGLSKEEFALARSALVGVWESIGLRAVPVDDFADTAQILRELRHVRDPGYAAPHDRARTVWDAHATEFDVLQAAHSNQLAGDALGLERVFGSALTSGTLWLAHPDGGLCRWASQDRIYTSAPHLRHIPSGYDSAWVAGQALGTEEVLVKGRPGGPDPTRQWQSVLAVPIFVSDGLHPSFGCGVVTFGLPDKASQYRAAQDEWAEAVDKVAIEWGKRLQDHAFSRSETKIDNHLGGAP